MRLYHCTWHNCTRPVFSLTLCRGHFRAFKVTCAWPQCQRMSYCRQVCAHHYRKHQFPPVQQCIDCNKASYIDNKMLLSLYCTQLCPMQSKSIFETIVSTALHATMENEQTAYKGL